MTERERLQAEIAALQARLNALPPEPDLSEAVKAYCGNRGLNFHINERSVEAGLRAAYPALRKAYGHDKPAWPDEDRLAEIAMSSARHQTGAVWVQEVARNAALETIRRIKQWQEANNG